MEETLAELGRFFIENRETVAVAESVTSGCIQLALSNIKDAKDFFQGGITVYNCGQKTRHLNIEPIFATQCNAVDINIAEQMALEVCKYFCSSIGMSTTGYAAPMPEAGIRQPFMYFAIARKGKILMSDKVAAVSDDYGSGVQNEYVERIFKAFLMHIR